MNNELNIYQSIAYTMKKVLIGLWGSLLLLASACSNGTGKEASDAPKPYPVMTVTTQTVALHKLYPATLQGLQTVEIRPRIVGYIEQILVDEGDYVKKGQLLFRLNATDLEATMRSARAQIKVAQAQVETARINLAKNRPLVDKGIVSEFELASSEAAYQSAEASLAQAEANYENANANLSYTHIVSPAEGYIGTFGYRTGSLVNSSIALPLTVVADISRIYAYFSFNEKELLALIRNAEGFDVAAKMKSLPPVSLVLADRSEYAHPGKIETIAGIVDAQTGAVSVRALFENPGLMLRSGNSARIRLTQTTDSAIVIPQRVTFDLQNKHFVYAVDSGNVVRTREIEVMAGDLKTTYVVLSGLTPGERIVADGIASLRDGMTIQPVHAELGQNAALQVQAKP